MSRVLHLLEKVQHHRDGKPPSKLTVSESSFPSSPDKRKHSPSTFKTSKNLSRVLIGIGLCFLLLSSILAAFWIQTGKNLPPALPEPAASLPADETVSAAGRILSPDSPKEEPLSATPAETEQESAIGYTIQLVSYLYESRAQKEAQKLMNSGFATFVIESGSFYQVCLGEFTDKVQANRMLMELKTRKFGKTYHDAFVRGF